MEKIKAALKNKKILIPSVIGIIILITLITVLVKNNSSEKGPVTKIWVTPTPTTKPTKTPTPSVTPKLITTLTITPTVTIKTTPTPTTAPTTARTPTPTPNKDTQPPSYSVIIPPSNQTISDNHFCFKVYDFHDNISSTNEIYFNFILDGNETGWVQNPDRCYENLSNSKHEAQIKVKDKEGNYALTNVSFTVQYSAPSATTAPSITPTPTAIATPTTVVSPT